MSSALFASFRVVCREYKQTKPLWGLQNNQKESPNSSDDILTFFLLAILTQSQRVITHRLNQNLQYIRLSLYIVKIFSPWCGGASALAQNGKDTMERCGKSLNLSIQKQIMIIFLFI